MSKLIKLALAACLMLSTTVMSAESVDIPSEVTLFKNVKVFNGTENKLYDVDILVVKNKIHKIGPCLS